MDALGHSLAALGAGVGPHVLGGAHTDASGIDHAPLSRYPLVILMARPGGIARLVDAAKHHPDVRCVDYPEDGHATTHDADYRSALSNRSAASLQYRAAALFGPRGSLDELCGTFSLYTEHRN
jgi:hypothetical protein